MSVKGAIEFKRFKDGKSLTRKQAILAQCYECNGYDAQDCLGNSCPLYGYHPYRKVLNLTSKTFRKLDSEHLRKLREGRIKAKEEKEVSLAKLKHILGPEAI